MRKFGGNARTPSSPRDFGVCVCVNRLVLVEEVNLASLNCAVFVREIGCEEEF